MSELQNSFKHIYIHWPFCKSRCYYCDFIALTDHETFFYPYHQALCKEIELVAQNFEKKQIIETIFLGGGSPSLYELHSLESLFQVLHKNFDLTKVQEITIETNPSDITEDKLKHWKSLGINRISIGIQILDDETLKKLNRQQTVSDALKAIELTPKFFENISIDLILGLPGVTKRTWQKTVTDVVKWPIKHISIYILTVYEKTPLFFKLKKNELKLEKEDTLIQLYEQSVKYLEEFGFLQYEISNFSKPKYKSLHNQAYWNRHPYYGFGLGASSFDGLKRFVNHNNIKNYIQSVANQNKIPIFSYECLNQQQIILEILMLSLRQKKGLSLHTMLYLLTDIQKIKLYKNIELLKNQSLLKQNKGKITLSLKGMLLENKVLFKLYEGLF